MADHQKPPYHGSQSHRDGYEDQISGAWFPVLNAGDPPPSDPEAIEDEDYIFLQNDIVQAGGAFEVWSFRRGIRVLELTRGVLDVSAAIGNIACTLPPAYVPVADMVLTTAVTVDGSAVIPATAHVDSSSGDVSLSWGGGVPWIRRSRTFSASPLGIPSGAGSDVAIVYDATDGSPDFSDYFSTPLSSTIRVLQSGVYEVMGEFHFDDDTFPEAIHFFWHNELGFPTKLPTVHQISGESGYAAFTWRCRLEAGRDCQVTVAQGNASAQDLLEGYWEMHYVGSYAGTNPGDADPDQ